MSKATIDVQAPVPENDVKTPKNSSETSKSRQQRLKEQIWTIRNRDCKESVREATIAQIIADNENFIFYIINKYYHFNQEHLSDLMQAGRIGVLVGLPSYDPERAAFGTFFAPYIKHEVSSALANCAGVSSHTAANISKVNKAAEQIKAKTGSETPTVNDLAVYSNLRPQSVESALNARKGIEALSLDFAGTGEDNSRELIEKIPSDYGNPAKETEKQEEVDEILAAINRLPSPEERRAVILSFGFDNMGNSRSHRQVGKIMNLEPSQVRKLLNGARRKLAGDERLRKMFAGYITATEAEEIPIASADYIQRELGQLF